MSRGGRPRGNLRGRAAVDGLDEDRGSRLEIAFQNEWVVAWRDAVPIAMSPDPICVLDTRGCARGDAIAILASLMPSSRSSPSLPTPLLDAAYEAVRFDEDWAINSRRAPSKSVKAMVCAKKSLADIKPGDFVASTACHQQLYRARTVVDYDRGRRQVTWSNDDSSPPPVGGVLVSSPRTVTKIDQATRRAGAPSQTG
jgi:hypothetical protein